jgi:hypothetical protein
MHRNAPTPTAVRISWFTTSIRREAESITGAIASSRIALELIRVECTDNWRMVSWYSRDKIIHRPAMHDAIPKPKRIMVIPTATVDIILLLLSSPYNISGSGSAQ